MLSAFVRLSIMQERIVTILRYVLLASLLAWGGFTLIYYAGVPVHQAVLLSDAGRQAVAAAGCASDAYFCQGLSALWPTITHSIARAEPFLAYGVLSLLAFLALLLAGFMQTGRWSMRFDVTPLRLLIGFFLSLWAVFTVLTFGSNGDQPMNRIFEPVPQIYQNASAEALETLRESFQLLQEKNCLTSVGQTPVGSGVYDVSRLCMQASFFTRVLSQAAMVLVLLFSMLTLGRMLLRSVLRCTPRTTGMEALYSVGLGAGGMIALLWVLAISHVYVALAGWLLLLAILGVGYRHAWYWLECLRNRRWTYNEAWHASTPILLWLLISLLALNFLNVIRPFPIGWDDLGRYINQPRLLVSYGHFIPTMGTFQWEYLTSLGFLLFGYDSIFGATLSMMINWSAGLLAVLAIFFFTRRFLGAGHGLLAALLYYSLPVVGHFSFADMKVDNAVFAMGTLSLLAVCSSLFPGEDDDAEEEEEVDGDAAGAFSWKAMALAGLFGGLAFAIKPTAIMMIMATGAVLFGAAVHWSAFLGVFSLTWLTYVLQGQLDIADISERIYGAPDVFNRPLILGALAVLGIGLLGYAMWLRPKAMRRTLAQAGIFIASFFAAVAPWLAYNNIAAGNVIPQLALSPPNAIAPSIVYTDANPEDLGQDIRRLPEELQLDPDHPACVSTSAVEELDRYWGFGGGWSHYLTLPFRSVMNLDTGGYYVTLVPAYLLFPLLLLLPYFWQRRGRWLRWTALAAAFMVVQWMLLANGIVWYGLGMFLGIVVGLEALTYRSPDRWNGTVAGILVGASLLIAFAMRFWQFEQQQNLFEYPLGKVTADAMRERTIPDYDDVREIVEARRTSMPERPYVYRIGTFIPYFLPKNLEVLPLGDQQLDTFNCLYQEQDSALTLKRLQALGFNSIIFDTNTQTIERDPNGSLHQKVGRFVDFINTPELGLDIAINDPANGIAFILLP